ncbi:hypothetical protein DV515_00019083, partial [Chloebia gouldiae]
RRQPQGIASPPLSDAIDVEEEVTYAENVDPQESGARIANLVGKLSAERERQPRTDTNRCRNISATFSMQPATTGSLGLDLAAAVTTTLMTSRPAKVPTGVYGPIRINGQTYGGLLLGRSSVTIMGLFVLPGVIDADYTGELQIMVHTPFPPVTIEKGQRIAQLIPLPQVTKGMPALDSHPRSQRGFGSSGLALLTMDLHSRPKKKIKLTYGSDTIELLGLLDTGADTSIVSPEKWPRTRHGYKITIWGTEGTDKVSEKDEEQ